MAWFNGHGGHLMAGAKARRGPSTCVPPGWVRGVGGTRLPSAPRPNPIPQFLPWGNCGPFPPIGESARGERGGKNRKRRSHHIALIWTRQNRSCFRLPRRLVLPHVSPSTLHHLPTSPSLPYTTFFTLHQSPHLSLPHPIPDPPLPHIDPSFHRLPNPHLCPTPPPEHQGPCLTTCRNV